MTSGPSIVVRILGDMANLGKNMDDTASKGTSAASKMHTAFSSVLDQLNASGVLGPFGGALSAADSALDGIGKHAKDVGPILLGVGGAVAGLGLALQQAGSKDAAAHQQLQAAVTATGKSYDKYADQVEAAIKHQEHFGNTADETQQALAKLTEATNDPKKALDLLNTATDLAAAKHEDLVTAAGQLGKAYNGNGRILKDFGITMAATGNAQAALTKATKDHNTALLGVASAQQNLTDAQAAYNADPSAQHTKDLKTAQDKLTAANLVALTSVNNLKTAHEKTGDAAKAHGQAIDTLSKKLTGQGAAAANTFGGKLDAIKAKFEDQIATIGQKYGPAITTAGAAMTGLGATLEIAKAATQAFKDQTILSSAATKVATAATWLWNAAMDANIIVVVVIAIAALVAIIILAYTHVALFRDIVNEAWTVMKVGFADIVGAVGAAFDFIKSHWELLAQIFLALLGPIGVVLAVFWHFHDQIVGFFEKLPGEILGAIGAVGSLLEGVGMSIINGLWDGLKWVWNAEVVGWLNIRDKITSAVGTMGALLFNVGKDVIKGLLDGMKTAWSDVSGWMGDMAGKIKGFITNPLKVLSPSRVMMEIGNNIMAGLGIGMAQGFTQHVVPALQVVPDVLGPGGGGSAFAPAGGTTGNGAAAGSAGPLVHVENANFAEPIDIDLFMKRAAWAARTAVL